MLEQGAQRQLDGEPAADARSGGVPPGHPALKAFLGLPLFHGGQLIGMVGLANAAGGYDEALVAELDKLHAEGVRYFLIDAPGKVVAEVAAATRGRELLLFNVSAPDDALRQAQCQAHLYHTLPNHGMQTDAIAQFLVFKKWRNVLLLQGPLDDDKLIGAAFENSARRLGLKIVAKKDFLLSNDPRQRELGNVGLLTAGADGCWQRVEPDSAAPAQATVLPGPTSALMTAW